MSSTATPERAPLAADSPTSAAVKVDNLPSWYPAWAKGLAERYFSRTASVFVLHGNVHDLVPTPSPEGSVQYLSLSEFLTSQLFGRWDVVLSHDLSRGLRPQAAGNSERLRSMVQYLTSRWGEPAAWPREPDKVLVLLENLVERILVDEPSARRSVAVIFEYAQFLVSAGDLDALARGQASRLVRFLSWAQSPHIRRMNMAFCLIADRLAEVNDRLVQSSYVASIEVPLPDRATRLDFIRSFSLDKKLTASTLR